MIKKSYKIAAASILLVAGLTVIYVFFLIKDLPKPSQFSNRQISQSTKIYDRTGEVLLYEIHGDEKRTVIAFEEIPDFAKLATLAAEDADFYNQPAFSWRAILRAVLANIRSGQFSQGGSTITQQLARNLFLTPQKTVTRKLKEIILAIELESRYSKDEIFALYLNQVPYGSNAYGIEAASQIYFGKSAKNLNLAEAAVLAAILKAPSYYSPWGSRQSELFERQKSVIARMGDLGFINEEETARALTQTAEIIFTPPASGIIKAPHLVLTVKEMLIDRYGEDVVERGGLKVTTTLDWKMQEIAEKAIFDGAARNDSLYQGRNAALVAQDPKTGQVLALVGSRDYYADTSLPEGCTPQVDCGFEPVFNVATQGLRQPGSALKPFAYLTAFEKGFSPKTLLFDVPTEFVAGNSDCPAIITPASDENSECFNPENFDGKFRGAVAMETALAQSINVPAVKTLYLGGFDDVLKTLADFGVSTLKERWRYGLSLVLGGGEVRLAELINAYAALAQEGIRHRQTMILKVEDSKGETLEEYQDQADRVTEPQYPRLINQILSDADLRRDLFQNSLNLTVFPDHEVALKTGTTNDYRDAWAMGYTPSIAVGVWAGNNDNTPMQRRGGSILAAVPIWSEFMKKVLPDYPPETFTKPEPTSLPDKPMLNGSYLYLSSGSNDTKPQVHNILYYADKKDPAGPLPADPYQDSQFENWETAVTDWVKKNLVLETTGRSPSPEQPKSDKLSVKFKNVRNGDFVPEPFHLEAEIVGPANLGVIELYLNHRLVDRKTLGGTYYLYSNRLTNLDSQNFIEIKITDYFGARAEAAIIVFH